MRSSDPPAAPATSAGDTTDRCGEKTETLLGPDELAPGGRYSIDFATDVAIASFTDHPALFPTERGADRGSW